MQNRNTRKAILYAAFFFTLTINHVLAQADKKSNAITFRKHILTTDFISEGVAVGDINKDKKMDVIAGAYWFEAPDWKRHEIAPGKAYNGAKEYSNSFLNFSMDVNQDGWIDMIWVDFPGKSAHWYENPKNKPGYWKEHLIGDSVGVGNESPGFVDVDNDGRRDLLCADVKTKQIVWLKSPSKKGDGTWLRFPVSAINSPGTNMFSHGLGLGDINGDGRADIMIKEGWWEAPKNRQQPDWTFHPAALGEDCSQMHVFDVNKDGKKDVMAAAAHRRGIWWYEQGVAPDGKEAWTKHLVTDSISQTHSSMLIDLNLDGHPDFITGKRFFAHNDTNNDPGTYEPPYLLWYEYIPGKSPSWIAHVIDNNSGVGLNIVAQDMTNDKLTDIVISNKKGVFLFENTSKKKR